MRASGFLQDYRSTARRPGPPFEVHFALSKISSNLEFRRNAPQGRQAGLFLGLTVDGDHGDVIELRCIIDMIK